MYGSSFTCVTRRPRASSRAPMDALARPLPIEETTPPVTKTYFVGLRLIFDPVEVAYSNARRDASHRARLPRLSPIGAVSATARGRASGPRRLARTRVLSPT